MFTSRSNANAAFTVTACISRKKTKKGCSEEKSCSESGSASFGQSRGSRSVTSCWSRSTRTKEERGEEKSGGRKGSGSESGGKRRCGNWSAKTQLPPPWAFKKESLRL